MDFSLYNTGDIKGELAKLYNSSRNGRSYFNPAGLTYRPSKYGAQYLLNKDILQKTTTPNVTNVSADGKDDGKISFKEKMKNFGVGLVAPIKKMFSSPKNIAITALSIAGGAALIALTGGAAAPVMVALGIAGGGIQIGKGIYKQVNAKTDAEAQQAWQQMGSGTFTVGVSAAGAKASLKAAGISNAKNTSVLSAIGQCFKSLPSNISKSFKTAGQNISGIITSVKSSAANSKNLNPDVIDVEYKIVDAPETGAAQLVSKIPDSTKPLALNAPNEKPMLPPGPNYLKITGSEQKLLLEAPKPQEIHNTTEIIKPAAIHNEIPKPGFLGKIKNVFKLFGFFTSEK